MNHNSGLEDKTIGDRIRTAIIDADRTSIRKILAILDSSQERHLLDNNKTDGEDHITLALRLGQRQIAIELLLRSLFEIDEWPYKMEQFTWLNLFDFIGNATISQLQEKLKHAKPLAINGDIDLKSLAKNLKYLKVAYLLGAPCQEGKLLGDLILNAHKKEFVLGRQRVCELVKTKICRRFPLSVSKTANWLVHNTETVRELLTNYPDWFEDTDEHGNNVLHHALLMDEFSASPFTYVWPIKSASVTSEKLVRLILQKNDKGQTPLVLYIKKSYNRIPIEFHVAIKQLVDIGDTDTINEILAIPNLHRKEHRDDDTSVKLFLHAFFIQHGYTNAASQKVLKELGNIEDIGLFLHHFDKKGNCSAEQPENTTEEEKEPEPTKDPSIMIRVKDYISLLPDLAMTRVKNYITPVKIETPHVYLSTATFHDLPTELICHIAESLKPSDLLTFAMCNKQLNNQFKVLMSGNEHFWKQYYHAHFHSVPEPQTTYRDHICTQFKVRNAWYHNKYSTITLPDNYTTLAMDENWLLMVDKSKQYCYWNCHTHEIIESNVKSVGKAADHIILNTYERGSLPMLFDGQNIIRGNQTCRLNSCKDIRSIKKAYPIDHRVVLRCNSPHWNTLVVNTETDCIEHTLKHWCWHNPFNNTLVSYDQPKLRVTDLRTSLQTHNYDMDLNCSNPDFWFADEHTMFYCDYREAGFIDLRTFKTISAVNLQSRRVDVTFSKERALLIADAQLFVSWHLPSQKIEWIEPAVGWPTFANSRYIVIGSHLQISKFVIRDYL